MTMRLTKQLSFLAEIDALKLVNRQSRIVGGSRRENSAEHSWHLAMFALILTPDGIDIFKVISMLLIHDIVEIDAGDAPLHGNHDSAAIAIAEKQAARRLFGILPPDQRDKLAELWAEFERAETREAQFAKAIDRFQPLLLNTLTDGGTWTDNGITEKEVYERYGPVISRGSAPIWERAVEMIQRHFAGLTS